MRFRNLLCVALLALCWTTPAAAQGLVEYALILVCDEACVDGRGQAQIQIPEALRDACDRSRDASTLCAEADALDGERLPFVMARLHEGGWDLDETAPIDGVTAHLLDHASCAQTDDGPKLADVWGHGFDVPDPGTRSRLGTVSRKATPTRSFTSVSRALREPPKPPRTACVDEVQERLRAGEKSLIPPGLGLGARQEDPASIVFIYFTTL
jgi:hypothetical protein